MGATSINYAFPVILHNWPFTRIAMPWGGLAACVVYLTLDVIVTAVLLKLVGIVFSSKEELLTYAYMGVNWSAALGSAARKPVDWHALADELGITFDEKAMLKLKAEMPFWRDRSVFDQAT